MHKSVIILSSFPHFVNRIYILRPSEPLNFHSQARCNLLRYHTGTPCTFRKQGGESRDLFWLFCTCIRTERVRKLFSTSLILSEFPCGTMKVPCLRKQQMNIEVSYVMRCIFLHNLEQRLSVFARGCVAKYSAHSNSS